MYALLAICLSFRPQFELIDENVNSQLMEIYGEKMLSKTNLLRLAMVSHLYITTRYDQIFCSNVVISWQ